MNFGTPVPLLVGIVLILIAVGLFFLDRFKPGYKRDSDTVYSILFLTVGILSLFQLNQDFMPSFQMMIFAGMLIALMIESIQRRTPGGQVKQSTPPYREPERDRPSRGYRAGYSESPRAELRVELDDDRFTPINDEPPARRIRGTGERDFSRDPYASRNDLRGNDLRSNEGYRNDSYEKDSYGTALTDEPRASRRGSRRDNSYEDEPPFTSEGGEARRRPLQLEGDANSDFSNPYSAESRSAESRSAEPRRPRGRGTQPADTFTDTFSEEPVVSSSRSRRRRPRSNNGDRPSDETYVDYKPLNPSGYPGDGEFDNSNNFDDDPKFS